MIRHECFVLCALEEKHWIDDSSRIWRNLVVMPYEKRKANVYRNQVAAWICKQCSSKLSSRGFALSLSTAGNDGWNTVHFFPFASVAVVWVSFLVCMYRGVELCSFLSRIFILCLWRLVCLFVRSSREGESPFPPLSPCHVETSISANWISFYY